MSCRHHPRCRTDDFTVHTCTSTHTHSRRNKLIPPAHWGSLEDQHSEHACQRSPAIHNVLIVKYTGLSGGGPAPFHEPTWECNHRHLTHITLIRRSPAVKRQVEQTSIHVLSLAQLTPDLARYRQTDKPFFVLAVVVCGAAHCCAHNR
jgi:hypothetical protein